MFEQLLVDAVIHIESCDHDPRTNDARAVSSKGAKGLMQIMDATGQEWWARIKRPDEEEYNPFDPTQNRRIGTAYLAELLQRYHGNVSFALAAYNWGMGNVYRAMKEHQVTDFPALEPLLPAETKAYVRNVLAEYSRRVDEAGLTMAANVSGELAKTKV